MKRKLNIMWMPCVLFFLSINFVSHSTPVHAKSGDTLQRLIDQTKAGGTLMLPAGTYDGPVIINKPMTIQGNAHVTIQGNGQSAIIQIRTNHVQLSHVSMIDKRDKPTEPAISIQGNDNQIDHVKLSPKSTAIQLSQSDDNRITEVTIHGRQSKISTENQGNGINLEKSNRNIITHNYIHSVHDGIYVENSATNQILNNDIDHSRYGIHLMFTAENTIASNIGEQNITGIMVMVTEKSRIHDNIFRKQTGRVYSQGMMLYHVKQAKVIQNHISGNLIGMYVDDTTNSQFEKNQIKANFVGIHMLNDRKNVFKNNEFINNVNQTEVKKSKDNEINGNYWDSFQGLDTTNDHFSNLSYKMNPFFYQMTDAYPPFELFFGSPGMELMETLFHVNPDKWAMDSSPSLKPIFYATVPATRGLTLVISLLLLFSSLSIIYMGVKQI